MKNCDLCLRYDNHIESIIQVCGYNLCQNHVKFIMTNKPGIINRRFGHDLPAIKMKEKLYGKIES